MFDSREGRAELLDHVLQLVVTRLLLPLVSGVTGSFSCKAKFWSECSDPPEVPLLTYIHAERHNLGGHGGHLVGEAVLVHAVHVGSEGVFSIGLSLSLMNGLAIRTHDPDIDVQESSLSHFEHETHLCSGLHFVEETFFSVGINCDEI